MNVTKRIKKTDEGNAANAALTPSNNDAQTNGSPNPSLPEFLKYAISATLVLFGIALVFGLSMLRESNAKGDSDALIPLVETSPVETFQGNLDLVLSGTVVPFREIQVGAQVSGIIARKFPQCEAGTFVKKGTPLIQIDTDDYNLEIQTVNNEILQAERTIAETDQEIVGAAKNLELAKTDFELQRNEFERRLKLKTSLSPTEMDQAKRNLLNSESQLTTRQNAYDSLLARKESLKATLELNKIRLKRAELNLKRTTVVAPVDGVIVRESVEEGSFAGVANALFIIEDTSKAEVLCNLTPGELAWLRRYAGEESIPQDHAGGVYNVPRVPVEIYEQSDPTVVWSGMLERFDGIGRNATTKSIPCKIIVDEPVCNVEGENCRVLVRGMFVKCRAVLSSSRSGSLGAIPLVAVRPGDYVWVVRDKKLSRVDIEVIDRSPFEAAADEAMVAVKLAGGLEIGDAIVVSPLPQPTEGGEVKLKEDATSELVDNSDSLPEQTSEVSKQTKESKRTDASRSEL